MQIKQIPEDFIVEENYDLDYFRNKDKEKNRKYYYFILRKVNYAQLRAIDKVSKIFNVSRKRIHFAGNKDKVGVTTQLISISDLNKDKLEVNLKFFNENVEDLSLEYVDVFNTRIGLGENLGNKFIITIRDLSKEEVKLIEKNLNIIKENGCKNYFDSQRFGYANNSHIVGKYILQNEVEKAVFEILTSLPEKPSQDLEIFVNKIKKNWNEIKSQDIDKINECIDHCPKFLNYEKFVLEHLKKFKNDFPGSFRTIHKKQRTLYVNAYQSYIFNYILDEFNLDDLKKIEKLELFNAETKYSDKIQTIVDNILKKDSLTKDNFSLKSMPELKLKTFLRNTIKCPKNLEIVSKLEDDLNNGKFKVKVSFELNSGEYATNVIKNLLKEDL